MAKNKIIYCNELASVLKERQFDVFAHECNCFGRSGPGLARLLKEFLPELAAADGATSKGDPGKLGSLSIANLADSKFAVNAYTRFDTFRPTEAGAGYAYDAVRKCFKSINRLMEQYRVNIIAMPKTEATCGSPDWELIEKIINTELCGREVRIYLHNARPGNH